MKRTTMGLMLAALLGTAFLAGGCAESSSVQANPVWSATVPEYGVEYSKTTNVFPWYSKNVTAYSDRIEEAGNAILFISWTKTTMRTPRPVAAPEEAGAVEAVEPVAVDAVEQAAEEMAE